MLEPPPQLETERLILRRPREGDAKSIFEAYGTDPEVTRYLAWRPHRSLADAEAALARRLEALASGTELSWLVTQREDAGVLGMVSLWPLGHHAELGYVLARRCWGRGYMSEATRALVEWALAQEEIYRVWAVTDVDNHASARVLEKIGMRREGRLRRFALHPNVSAEPRDCLVYARIVDDPA